MGVLRVLLCAALAFAVDAGCFSRPRPECGFSCASDGVCPTDYVCGADKLCHLRLDNGGLGKCEIQYDAAVAFDGATLDASFDAAPDAAPDAMPVCPALTPASDGTNRQSLIVSEVRPGQFIELYNNTAVSITLATSGYGLATNGARYELAAETGVIPAASYRSIAWPAAFTMTDATTGEIGLFEMVVAPASYMDGAKLVDYLCWGTETSKFKALAETATKWSGACASALSMMSIQRLPSTAGTEAAHYVTTLPADQNSCTVP